jgi:AcrR family transcriptional regulator
MHTHEPDAPAGDTESMRSRLVARMMQSLRTRPLHEVTVESVAREADTTPETVEAVFPSWDGLLLATIDQWNDQRTGPLMGIAEQHGTIRFLRAIVTSNIADPALMRFLTSMLSIAAAPDHPLAPMLHMRRGFHAFVQRALERDVQLGREPGTMEPARGSEQLLATYEGLQLQSMVRPDMDLLEAYDRAVTRLREGWAREYVAPVWDLELAS